MIYPWTPEMARRSTIKRSRRALLGLVALVFGIPLMAEAQNPVHWSIGLTDKDTIQASQIFDVELIAEIDPTWHLYAINQPPGGPVPLEIGVAAGRTFGLAGEIGSWLPKTGLDPNFNLETLFYEDRASFTL